jgi:hypothetical protein
MAASRTLRLIGPAVSWLWAMGMIPARLTSPSVGLRPTMPFAEDGQTIEPSVSVPMARAQRFAATAPPEPELEPQGLRSSTYGFFACPPRALHPLLERGERMLAHSLRLAFPSRTAPASRSLRATVASRGGTDPERASEPAVVVVLSAVSTLSLRRIGIPCSGPRTWPRRRSASSASAMASASGVVSMTWRRAGPLRSSASMRA